MKTRVLDCHSIDSIFESIENITGINRGDIEHFLYVLDLEKYCQKVGCYAPANSILLDAFNKEYAKCKMDYEYTYWFHLSRTHDINSFNDGILTTNGRLENIWQYIYDILDDDFSKNELVLFRENMDTGKISGDFAMLYRLKTIGESANLHQGPYAILIRDTAFRTEEIGTHDYLKIPEIVEDICECFKKTFRYDLMKRYTNNTFPCIIKFRTSLTSPKYLGSAMLYLYSQLHGLQVYPDSNVCFDGQGKTIIKKDIVRIELIGERDGVR